MSDARPDEHPFLNFIMKKNGF